jgi:ketosteroid isomerase-like protein
MTAIVTLLLQLEQERCQALLAGDRERLVQIMHPDLFHVHARGNVEDFEAYTGSGALKSTYAILRRFDDLTVRVLGDAALMTGRQLAVSTRKATGEVFYIDSMVTQVWVRHGDRWQQLSYQTTPMELTVAPVPAQR